jgi:hypothetical protein
MNHFSHFSVAVLLILSPIHVSNYRSNKAESLDPYLNIVFPCHPRNSEKQALEEPGGEFNKLQGSQKGTRMSLITEQMGGRIFGNMHSLKKK